MISLLSLSGILPYILNKKRLPERWLQYLVSFSVGSYFGAVFYHLIPEMFSSSSQPIFSSTYILAGIFFSYVLEEFLIWRHCHEQVSDEHPHTLGYMSLFGDMIHNVVDGLMIAGSFQVSASMGFTTTLAVASHELPAEIGDFSVLMYSGFTVRKAVLFNFLTSLTAYMGVFLAFLFGAFRDEFTLILLPFTAGNFIYIAGSDLIPELHTESDLRSSIMKVIMMFAGLFLLYLLRELG